MKSVYLFVLVSLCQGLPLKTLPAELSSPHIEQVTVQDPLAIKVSWNKIVSDDAKNPVIGYQVKVWKVEKIETITQDIVDGKLINTVKESLEPIDVFHAPSGVPDVIVTSAKETTTIYRDAKRGVTYEIRVQAYTSNGESPSSDPIRVTLEKNS